MATNAHPNSRDALVRVAAIAAVLSAAIATVPTSSTTQLRAAGERLDADELDLMGYAGHVPDSKKPKLTATFPRESYRPDRTARLVITDRASNVSLQVFRAGGEATPTVANDVLLGSPVTAPRTIGSVNGRRIVPVTIGNWPSGMYFVELRARGRTGYAPFVLRPRRLGEHPVAIVMPTQTWQAYNFRDDDGNGRPNTWYAGGSTARLGRPFLNRGVPPHFKYYDAPFLRWAMQTHHDADYLSDADLNNTRSGARLRAAYELVIFEGHHEYVTTHEYDVVEGFRNLGGNLMFLSANNFFWQVVKHGDLMTRTQKWRDLGRPEAALIGVQYFGNDMGEHRKRWIVRGGARNPKWLLDGTDLAVGAEFSSGGIEADDVVAASPKNVRIIAQLPDLFGNGHNADMTYYETTGGAKVYAAGAFTVAGSVWEPHVRQLVENLWRHLSVD
ncbi:MAG: N,N-dimethylformamidase beta subunit family domain-containing protein [Thermoleophilia bacterium]